MPLPAPADACAKIAAEQTPGTRLQGWAESALRHRKCGGPGPCISAV